MKKLLVILFSVVAALADNNIADEQYEVTAPIGRIRGSTLTSRLGKKIYSFRAVRYAEPPTGQRRFQVKL
ncbi:hypothetical protein X777_05618 [Ooceraea biroi]|uniref:Carboxylesterase type B domain-containing protein n=1 Tax=Ooceraea biroi TaxID=2015173 RepID=A0A026WEL1_OOCBI|nr:hypothetical protein X777_05618 [Ooceraea biroi]